MAANKPVIIEGAISHWPAIRLWTDAYLADRLRDTEAGAASDARALITSGRSR